jgi:phage terminase small subunit
MHAKKLSEKERRFIDAYLGDCRGNGAAAAVAAGYKPDNARAQASRLLTKANVRAALEAVQAQRTDAAIADANERDRIATAAARDAGADWHIRLKAIGELNKCEGRHSMSVKHSGRISLEDILTESRG